MTHRKIYVVTELSSGKQYVGQTKRNDGRAHGIIMEHKYRKHGVIGYSYEVLIDGITSKKLTDYLEKFYIKILNTITPHGYNIATGGYGGGTDNPEIRKKISETLTNNYRDDPSIALKISASLKGRPSPMKGRKHSEESKSKARNKLLGRKYSPESLAKMSKAQQGKVISDESRGRMSVSAKIRANTPEGLAHMKNASLAALEAKK